MPIWTQEEINTKQGTLNYFNDTLRAIDKYLAEIKRKPYSTTIDMVSTVKSLVEDAATVNNMLNREGVFDIETARKYAGQLLPLLGKLDNLRYDIETKTTAGVAWDFYREKVIIPTVNKLSTITTDYAKSLLDKYKKIDEFAKTGEEIQTLMNKIPARYKTPEILASWEVIRPEWEKVKGNRDLIRTRFYQIAGVSLDEVIARPGYGLGAFLTTAIAITALAAILIVTVTIAVVIGTKALGIRDNAIYLMAVLKRKIEKEQIAQKEYEAKVERIKARTDLSPEQKEDLLDLAIAERDKKLVEIQKQADKEAAQAPKPEWGWIALVGTGIIGGSYILAKVLPTVLAKKGK